MYACYRGYRLTPAAGGNPGKGQGLLDIGDHFRIDLVMAAFTALHGGPGQHFSRGNRGLFQLLGNFQKRQLHKSLSIRGIFGGPQAGQHAGEGVSNLLESRPGTPCRRRAWPDVDLIEDGVEILLVDFSILDGPGDDRP